MNKITIITAIASAYATVAATSFTISFAAPAKAHVKGNAVSVREVPPYESLPPEAAGSTHRRCGHPGGRRSADAAAAVAGSEHWFRYRI